MAKLTVRFRSEIKKIHRFDQGIITIGRDSDNTICIDSLAIAPKHVIIDFEHPDGPRLIREDDQFPVRINGREVERHTLKDGDVVSLGKHNLLYQEEKTAKTETASPGFLDPIPRAGLQILNGKHIGRLIPIKNPITRIGHPGGSIAVISLRKDGFHLSSLDGEEQILLNGDPIGNKVIPLNDGDRLEIDGRKFLFFT